LNEVDSPLSLCSLPCIKINALRREEATTRVGALIMGWRVGELLQSIEGVK
jgi:hypothetical protein|tara:strand:- start:277 stop:429 length:153 start_codon:yes stop_codon:yes gene_type:complete